MDPVETLKQKLVDELISIDGEISGEDLVNFKSNALDLGLDELQFNSLLKEAGNLAHWKKRKKEKGVIPVPIEPHVVVFDEKVISLEELGQVLFENPLKAGQYLSDDTLLKADVNYLTSNDVNKIFKILKIYKSETDAAKRYLKIVYYLNPSLPYSVGNNMSANFSELLDKSFQNYDYYKQVFNGFENGLLQIWLRDTNQFKIGSMPGDNSYLSFLNFIYGINAGYPFYLNLELFSTPVELAGKVLDDPYLKDAMIDRVNRDGLLVWINAVEDLTKTTNYGYPGSAYENVAVETVVDAIKTLESISSAEAEPILLKESEIVKPVKIDVPQNITEPIPIKKNISPVQSNVDPGQQKVSSIRTLNPLARIMQSSKGPIILALGIVAVIIGVLLFYIFKPNLHITVVSGNVISTDSTKKPHPTPAAKSNQPDLISLSARLYSQGNDFYQQKNYKAAFDAFKRADSAVVNTKAESMLGNIYYMGLGATQSDSIALKWYLKSAEQKNPAAMYSIGLIYANGGKEVKRDILKAYQYLAWVAENATDEAIKNSAKEKLKEINEH